jgi:hypothetical protein
VCRGKSRLIERGLDEVEEWNEICDVGVDDVVVVVVVES